MRVEEKELLGDTFKCERLTKDWYSVDIQWLAFEIDYETYGPLANSLEGMWTALCDDRTAEVRFQYESDAKEFKQRYGQVIHESEVYI